MKSLALKFYPPGPLAADCPFLYNEGYLKYVICIRVGQII